MQQASTTAAAAKDKADMLQRLSKEALQQQLVDRAATLALALAKAEADKNAELAKLATAHAQQSQSMMQQQVYTILPL